MAVARNRIDLQAISRLVRRLSRLEGPIPWMKMLEVLTRILELEIEICE